MKKLGDILFSQRITLILVSVFAVAIAVATFVEDRHDTATAKKLIYSARWMEFLLLLLVLNLIGVVIKRKLFRKEKLTVLLFHLGFIFMIIGAGATRYFGYEGSMHIREGESSNEIYTSDTYLQIMTSENDPESVKSIEMDNSMFASGPFEESVEIEEKGELKLTFKDLIFNAVEEITENTAEGVDMIEVKVATKTGNISDFIAEGETKQIGNQIFSFNTNDQSAAVRIIKKGANLFLSSTSELHMTTMGATGKDSIPADSIGEFKINQIYSADENLFMFLKYYVKAKKHLVRGNPEMNNPDAIIAEVEYKGQKNELHIYGGSGFVANMKDYQIDDLSLKMAYGNKPIVLPFSIYLKDFTLERYPGSNNPSSFESEIILIDDRENIKKDYKIYMNNILDHDGYRFFQSSYDRDELGTVLSVNHDRLGTWITYFSYILLLFGFVSTFFNKKSRFSLLTRRIKKAHTARKSAVAVIALIIGLSTTGFSQNAIQKPVSEEHADKFGHLIVQTYNGRFQPVHTLAYDVIHKIYKKNSITTEEKGKLDGMQLYMDFIIDSEFWKTKKIIYVKEPSIRNLIGITGKHAAFNDFFDHNNQYILGDFSKAAYEKSKADKNKFDKEIMKVDERLNVLFMTFRGSMLKVFPDQNSTNNKWVSIDDSASYKPLTGSINVINEDLRLNILSYAGIFQLYFQNVAEAVKTNNYKRSDQILGYIDNIQRQTNLSDILPSESKIKTEVHYNKAQIFVMLKYVYMILSVFLLLLAFTDHLRAKKSKLISYLLSFFIILLGAGFLYHTYGLVLRWYLSGHAPWSNGYEVLVFIAWGALLAGFSFMRYSKIILAATALLAFLIMLTAGFSNYDPQITDLVPVLKSYWLIIHVAVIVISYCFFGLACILGLMNLFIYLFKNNKNALKLEMTIKDLTNFNEMILIIGIVLATIGTFLGAVWANESWGRYWGWDAKETWALIILMVYAVVLHLRLVPSLNKVFLFNVGSVIAFGSVIMTFFGVNYYFSKGLHSYASGDKALFPTWAWVVIISIFLLIAAANFKSKKFVEEFKEEE